MVLVGNWSGSSEVFVIAEGGTFAVPASGATLRLGFADGFSFEGLPGYYQDNTGSFQAALTWQSPSPSPSPSQTGEADLCVKVVAQQFDGSNFYEHDSCANTASGTHEFLWYKRFPLFISVTNRGPDTATDVKARVTLPEALFFDDHVESVCGKGARQRTCRFGSIASGATTESDQLRVGGTGVLEATPAEIQVVLNSSTPDSNTIDNEASVTTTKLPGGADLETRASGPGRADGSNIVTYRAVLLNNGPEEAKQVRFTGSFDLGRSDLRTVRSISASRNGCEADASGFTCQFRRVAATRAGEVLVTVKIVVPNAPGREITFRTYASSDTPDPVARNDQDKQRTSIR